MARRIDIGGRQGRGNPEVWRKDSEHEDLGGLLGLLFWGLVAWIVVLVVAFVLPDALSYMLRIVIDADAGWIDCTLRDCA